MLDFNGKTLLQRQIKAYNDCGIKDITVIRGYKKEKINYKNLNYVTNKDYKNNNVLNSIFYAEKIINGNIIISYSDILFDASVVKRLMESDHDISVVVDIDWRGYYVGRKDHPLSEAENVIFDSNNKVLKIGKIGTQKKEVHGEFIGMIKLTNTGAEIFKENFHRVKKKFWNKPFQRAPIFQKAYVTDMIQELVLDLSNFFSIFLISSLPILLSLKVLNSETISGLSLINFSISGAIVFFEFPAKSYIKFISTLSIFDNFFTNSFFGAARFPFSISFR